MELQELLTDGFTRQPEFVRELRDRGRTALLECRQNCTTAIG